MKVAGNKVKHIVDLYFLELKSVYEKGEIEAILNTVFEFYLGFSRNKFILRAEENINQSDLLKLYKCYEELQEGKPLQYILGEVWFYNLKFCVNENVLIPRPETEELVDIILNDLHNLTKDSVNIGPSTLDNAGDEVVLLDIGTGSGCIPISIKANVKTCNVSACDISAEALSVAKKNAWLNKLEISFFESDVLNATQFEKSIKTKFDIIVSNPPYIKQSEKILLNKNVIEYEPHLALFVENEDDIIFYKKIIDACKNLLNEKGRLYFELNPLTANEVKNYAVESNLFNSVELLRDMSGKFRFLKAMKA